MVTVANIDGVRITFYFNEHPPPHFHAIFAAFKASIRVEDGALLKGSLPPAKLAMVGEWMASRKSALLAAFELSLNHTDPGEIG